MQVVCTNEPPPSVHTCFTPKTPALGTFTTAQDAVLLISIVLMVVETGAVLWFEVHPAPI